MRMRSTVIYVRQQGVINKFRVVHFHSFFSQITQNKPYLLFHTFLLKHFQLSEINFAILLPQRTYDYFESWSWFRFRVQVAPLFDPKEQERLARKTAILTRGKEERCLAFSLNLVVRTSPDPKWDFGLHSKTRRLFHAALQILLKYNNTF